MNELDYAANRTSAMPAYKPPVPRTSEPTMYKPREAPTASRRNAPEQ